MRPLDRWLLSRVRLRVAALVVFATFGSSCASLDVDEVAGVIGGVGGSPAALSGDEIVRGLKEALTKGSTAVVSQLGQAEGFSADPIARIPLPDSLQRPAEFARRVGLGNLFDDLELRLNQAAEEATPKAQALFVGAIRSMSIDDARGILTGEDDAATQYFKQETDGELTTQMRPIVDNALAQVGAVSAFNSLVDRVSSVPLAPQINADLTGYVTDKAKAGIFHYLAAEEKAIRDNPVERTSAILQRVFGSQR